MEFREFPKIPRLSRECIITEKIDGTNASIYIGVSEDGTPEFLTGSRTRWITPESDNHGFSRWAHEHRAELETGLGSGLHFGEWWGQGIQRSYGLKEKRFSLFNVSRWCLAGKEPQVWKTNMKTGEVTYQDMLPACVGLVPVLERGMFNDETVLRALTGLVVYGSAAAPGFMKPEGIVIYHIAGNLMFKKTIEKDEVPKGGNDA